MANAPKTARKKRSKSAPENETKQARFIRLAEPRVNKVIVALRGLAKLANKGSYEFTEDQAKLMWEILGKEFDAAEDRFMNPGKPTTAAKFSFTNAAIA